MADFKINYEFLHQGSSWTETYYAQYVDIDACLTAAKEVLPLRCDLLGFGSVDTAPRCQLIRVSDVTVQRDALNEAVAPENGRSRTGAGNADYAGLSVLVRGEATSKYHRQLYLSGQPDQCCQNGVYFAEPSWVIAFNRFAASLVARPWGIFAVNKDADKIRITRITQLPDHLVELTTTVPPGLRIGDTIKILSAPGVTGARGNHTVYDLPAGGGKIVYVGDIEGLYRAGGEFQVRTPILRRFTRLQVVRVTGKKRKGPFGQRAGRPR